MNLILIAILAPTDHKKNNEKRLFCTLHFACKLLLCLHVLKENSKEGITEKVEGGISQFTDQALPHH